MRIEVLKTEHIAALAAIDAVCFGQAAWSVAGFESELQNASSLCLCALEGEDALGCIAANLSEDTAFISKVAVTPAARRKGVAKALLRTLCEQVSERGVKEVTLEVRASNEAAQALYTSCDFEKIGKRRDFYRFPKEDAVIMTKNLC